VKTPALAAILMLAVVPLVGCDRLQQQRDCDYAVADASVDVNIADEKVIEDLRDALSNGSVDAEAVKADEDARNAAVRKLHEVDKCLLENK
jgi:hypothetical protein